MTLINGIRGNFFVTLYICHHIMYKVIFMYYIILWILALYGIWELSSRIVESMKKEDVECEVVVKVFNKEAGIEKLISDIEKLYLVNQITVIDIGSTDRTVAILRRLEEENVKIKVIERR